MIKSSPIFTFFTGAGRAMPRGARRASAPRRKASHRALSDRPARSARRRHSAPRGRGTRDSLRADPAAGRRARGRFRAGSASPLSADNRLLAGGAGARMSECLRGLVEKCAERVRIVPTRRGRFGALHALPEAVERLLRHDEFFHADPSVSCYSDCHAPVRRRIGFLRRI